MSSSSSLRLLWSLWTLLVLLLLLLGGHNTHGEAVSEEEERQEEEEGFLLSLLSSATTTTSTTTRRTTATDDNDNDNNNSNNNNNTTALTCPPCPQQCTNSSNSNNNNNGESPIVPTIDDDEHENDDDENDEENEDEGTITCQILVLDSPGIITMVDWNARDYYQYTNGRVKIDIKLISTMDGLYEEIENDAKFGGGLFDAYYTNPVILGTAATLGGLMDLTEHVKNNPLADWTDVLLALRTYVTSFEDKIYIILLDGDTHTMFYRRDVFEHFHLQVPRTWDEYTNVAKIVHGQTFGDDGQILNGSCISRIKGDHAMFWSHLILSTITQTHGTSTGSLFDTSDMTPLAGQAIAEMLRIHEDHMKYGTEDELSDIINHVQNGHMNDGTCVMTFMWGDMFRRSNSQGSILHDKLGIAPTPGSQVVLNRQTGQLQPCTKEVCPYAKYYNDIGFVNSAPYAANGGWGAAISNNAPPEKQKALADFFIWASSRDQAQQYVIPNSTLPWYEINGQDPWRKSQLDVDKWVEQGFDRELSKQYVESILTNLVSKNVVVEIRFPKAGEIMSVLDFEVNEHLVKIAGNQIPETSKPTQRLEVAQRIADQWNQIIKTYNARGDTSVPILETYQRLRGVYIPNEDKNYLTKIRPVGLTMMVLIWVTAIFCIGWVYVKQKAPVVRASQPPFLLLICLGVIIMASSIIPMGIDDGVTSSFDGASQACMATPWLVSLGFSVCFAALFSKIWRLKTLMNHAANFRRIQVRVQDVLAPFVVIMVLNLAFLLTWTLVDPLYWERVDLGRTGDGTKESYGRCTAAGNVSSIMAGLLIAVAIFALLLANIQTYQTRELSIAFNESKFVALAMASILQAALIGLPLLFLADTNTTARYLVRCILVFVICMSVMVFIFVPKILRGDKKDENPGRISVMQSSGHGPWQSSTNIAASAAMIASAAMDSSSRDQKQSYSSGVESDPPRRLSAVRFSSDASQLASKEFSEPKLSSGVDSETITKFWGAENDSVHSTPVSAPDDSFRSSKDEAIPSGGVGGESVDNISPTDSISLETEEAKTVNVVGADGINATKNLKPNATESLKPEEQKAQDALEKMETG